MKKELLFVVLITATFFTVGAQKQEPVQLLIHYKFTHVRDTTNREHPYMENMVLLVGKSASAYKSYDGQLQDALFRKQVAEQKAASPDGRIRINRSSSASGTAYYQFPNENKLFTRDRILFNSYLMEDPMPVIDWKISNDTSSFGGLHCQKATTHFKGRDYIAWFCPDLPVRTGPWKLNGLPGVIVEAYDSKKDVVFRFDYLEKAVPSTAKTEVVDGDHANEDGHAAIILGMEGAAEDPGVVAVPAKAIKTTQKEFNNLKEAMRKDPNAVAASMVAAQGGGAPGSGPGPKIDVRVAPPVVVNNPIELP
jgi:GLPGLI family protein